MEKENDEVDLSGIVLDAGKFDSAVLKRLVEEVKISQINKIDAYNRLHNRHNRTGYPRPSWPNPILPTSPASKPNE